MWHCIGVKIIGVNLPIRFLACTWLTWPNHIHLSVEKAFCTGRTLLSRDHWHKQPEGFLQEQSYSLCHCVRVCFQSWHKWLLLLLSRLMKKRCSNCFRIQRFCSIIRHNRACCNTYSKQVYADFSCFLSELDLAQKLWWFSEPDFKRVCARSCCCSVVFLVYFTTSLVWCVWCVWCVCCKSWYKSYGSMVVWQLIALKHVTCYGGAMHCSVCCSPAKFSIDDQRQLNFPPLYVSFSATWHAWQKHFLSCWHCPTHSVFKYWHLARNAAS